MAQISTYTKDTNLSDDDILIGSDADNSLVTANFALSAIKDYVNEDITWAGLSDNPWSLIDVEGTNDGIEFNHPGDIFFITHNTDSSASNDDTIGHWHQRFQSDADNTVNGIGIRGEVKDTSDGDEDASLYINAVVDGTEDTELASFHKGTSRIMSALKVNNTTDEQTIAFEVIGKIAEGDSSTTDLFRVNQGNGSSDAHIDLDVPSKFQSYTTTERDNITGPATGWTIYNETTGVIEVYNGTSWDTVGSPTLTASRLVVTDTSGQLDVSDITLTELGYLDGVTSAIQTQIDGIDEFAPSNTGSANQILQRTASGYQWADASAASFTLAAATASTLGGVIVPDSSDIDIDSSGNLSLGNLNANKITSGVLPQARYADVTNSKIDSESASDGYVLTADGDGNTAWEAITGTGHTIQDDGTGVADRSNLNFVAPLTVTDDSTNDRTSIGLTLTQSDLPNLSAGKITTGVFDNERLSTDTPTNGQVLTYKASDDTMEWTTPSSGAGTVTANPGQNDNNTDLTSITIGDTNYNIPSGGGGEGGGLDKYSDDETYEQDDVVWFEDDDKIYVWTSSTDSTAGTSPSDDTTNWQELSEGVEVEANPSGTDGNEINRIRISGTNYNLPDSGTPGAENTVYETVTIPVTGTRSNVISDGTNEIMRLHINKDFSGDGGGEFTVDEGSSGQGIFGGIPSGLTGNYLKFRLVASAFSNISSDIDITTNVNATISEGNTYDNLKNGLEGKTYTVDGVTRTISVSEDEITFPGLVLASGATIWGELRDNFNDPSRVLRAYTSTTTIVNNGAEATKVVVDPDTSDAVYSGSVTVFSTSNENAESILDRIGDDLADLHDDITYDGTVNDGRIFHAEQDFDEYDGVGDLSEDKYSIVYKTGSSTLARSSIAATADLETVFAAADEANDTNRFATRRVGDSCAISHDANVQVTIGNATADFEVLGVQVGGVSLGNTSSLCLYRLGYISGTKSGTIGTAISGTEDLTLGASIKEYTDTKYIDVDLGTTSPVSHSVTFTANDGTNVDGEVQDIDAVAGSGTSTTYTVTDYSGTEVTSFTSFVSSDSDTDLSSVMESIVDAVNDNTETPVDFTAEWDSSEKELTLTGRPGEVDGNWSITATHSSDDAAGDISFGTQTKTETSISYIERGVVVLDYDNLPTSDPEYKGQVWRDANNFLKISTG